MRKQPKHKHFPPAAARCSLCGVAHPNELRYLPPITLEYLLRHTTRAYLADFEQPCETHGQHTLRLWVAVHTCGQLTPVDVTSMEGTELSPPATALMPRACIHCQAPLGRFARRG